MRKAFITGSVTERLLCLITANLPENLIRLAFAFNPVLIWKLKLREVNKFAKIAELLISSRGKIPSQVCVAPEPILFPLSLLGLPHAGVGSLVMKVLDSAPQGAAAGILDRPVLCIVNIGQSSPSYQMGVGPQPDDESIPICFHLEVVVSQAENH